MIAVPDADELPSEDLDTFLSRAQELDSDQRKVIVRQALRLFEDYYVHLVFKRSLYGVDPVQRLRVLLEDVDSFPDTQAFHEEVLSIFTSVRDLHTAYKLPLHFHRRAAVLPFTLAEYYVDGTPHIVVSAVEEEWERFATDRSGVPFTRGVVVTTWNGLPVQRAIADNAERQGGCNPAARHARGLSTMTDRPLSLSPAPRETSIRLEFTDEAGATGTVTCRWRVIEFTSLDATNPTMVKGLGVDALGEAVRRSRKTRLQPELIAKEPKPRAPSELKRPVGSLPSQPPSYADALEARTLTIGGRDFGHLRIKTFGVLTTGGFVAEVRRLLATLPQDGLILDVRGNGGGVIASGEALLQLFTPRRVIPEPLQLRVTDATRALAASSREVSAFGPSLQRAIETAEVYSDRQPLDRAHGHVCNMTGQCYRGPVVLIVDALCYSTTDIFAAGFQDHRIGKIIGVDANTGAGGANVWDYERLRKASGGTGFENLPDGTDMRIAIRRTLRVRGSDGIPVEEFGIDIKDEDRHATTRADVLEGDVDLFAKAAYYLTHHSRPPCRLDVVAEAIQGEGMRLTITTDRLTRLDAYLKGRPLCASIDLEPADEVITTIDFDGDETTALQIFGYDPRGGPVTEAAGPVAIFMPDDKPAPPATAAPPPPRADEDNMADMPFDGYDKMTDDEVRTRIAQELFKALDGYRAMIGRARDTAKPNGHKNMIAEFTTELATLDDQIEEGTQRWGGLPDP